MSDTMTINGRAYRCTTPRFSIKAAMVAAITSFMVGGLISLILLIVFFPLGLLSALLTLALPFVMGSIIRAAPCPHCAGTVQMIGKASKCPDCRTSLALRDGKVVDLTR